MKEEHLQKLVEHAEPKPSYNIVTGNINRLQTVFSPSLVSAGGSCHYEMVLGNMLFLSKYQRNK